jgi:hypothetical protein
MPKTTQRPTTKPRFDVLVADTYQNSTGEDQTNWIRVGVAFPHADGDGFQIELKALPVSGRLVMRLHKAKAE